MRRSGRAEDLADTARSRENGGPRPVRRFASAAEK
jgi:hypothetical protein